MAITRQIQTDIAALYVALFGRAPDSQGLGFWAGEVDRGQSLTTIANRMYDTAPARAYYPTTATDIEIVNSFYQNVLGRPADPQGQSFWLGRLVDVGDRGALIQEMITTVVTYTGSPDNPALNSLGFGSRDLFLNRIEVAVYYGLRNGDIANAAGVLQNISADASTVGPAKASIDLTYIPTPPAPPPPGQAPAPAPPDIGTTTPIATISDDVAGVASGPVRVKIVFNKAVSGFGIEDIVLRVGDAALLPPAALSNFTAGGDGQTYFVTLTPPANFVGNVTVDLQSSGARDGGNVGNAVVLSNTQAFNTSAPAVVITDVLDDVAPVAGSVTDGGATNDSTPTIVGTLANPLGAGSQLALFVNGSGGTLGAKLGTAAITADGLNWSFTPAASLPQGNYSVLAVALDSTGRQLAASALRSLSIDTTAPTQAVTITGVNDDVQPVVGDVPGNGSTNDTTPTITGTVNGALQPGEVLAVFNGSVKLGEATVNGSNWSFTPNLPPTAGTTYVLTAAVMDAAGNLGPSGQRTFTLDTARPLQTVSLLDVTDNVELYTGSVPNGGLTNDNTPTMTGGLSGPLATGEVVRVFNGINELGDAIVTATPTATGISYSWSLTTTALPATPGSGYVVSARVVDAAGNIGNASASRSFTLDTTPPPGPPTGVSSLTLEDVQDNVDPTQGSVSNDGFGFTNDTTPTVFGTGRGTLTADGKVIVFNGIAPLGEAVAVPTPGGFQWTFTPAVPLAEGSYSLIARVVDAAGNIARSGTTPIETVMRAVTIDSTPPTQLVQITSVTNDIDQNSLKAVPNAGVTNDPTPRIGGSLSAPLGAGERLEILDGGVKIGEASASGIFWSFTPGTPLPAGLHTITAQVIDGTGQTGTPSAARGFSVDTAPPVAFINAVRSAGTTGQIVLQSTESGTENVSPGALVANVAKTVAVSPQPSAALTRKLDVADAAGNLAVNLDSVIKDVYLTAGTQAGETIDLGTPGSTAASARHIVFGFGGNDQITGGGFNDTIFGGAGNDTVNAGAGADTIGYEATAAGNGVDSVLTFTAGAGPQGIGGDRLDFTAFLGAITAKTDSPAYTAVPDALTGGLQPVIGALPVPTLPVSVSLVPTDNDAAPRDDMDAYESQTVLSSDLGLPISTPGLPLPNISSGSVSDLLGNNLANGSIVTFRFATGELGMGVAQPTVENIDALFGTAIGRFAPTEAGEKYVFLAGVTGSSTVAVFYVEYNAADNSVVSGLPVLGNTTAVTSVGTISLAPGQSVDTFIAANFV